MTAIDAAATTTTTAVDVRSLSVDLGGRRVLTDIDLSLVSGEFVGLIGPNGAGKTTLLRSILGLVRTVGGTITVTGGRRALGYVPQRHEFAWDFPLSVRDVVMTGRTGTLGWLRRPGRADHLAVATALERVAMSDLADRTVGELSGGQRQRVLVARALAAGPTVLLLDEPFTGLDMPSQESLTLLFTSLAAEGTTVLMTTHDLLGAQHSCERLVLVNGGIIADGPARTMTDPQLWMDTFRISPTHPLLSVLGVAR